MYCDYLLCTVTVSGHIIRVCDIVVTTKIQFIRPVEYLKLSFETNRFKILLFLQKE